MAERRIFYEDARVGQPYVIRSYLAPERNSGEQEEAAALTVLAEILGGGMTSVLSEKLQFEEDTAVYTGAHYSGKSLDETTFELIVAPSAGVTLQEVETAMDDVLADFLGAPIDPDQLERIKMQLKAEEIYGRDDVNQVANRYGRALTQGLTVEDVQAWPEMLQAVTADDVLAAARSVFNRDKAVTGWMKVPEVSQ